MVAEDNNLSMKSGDVIKSCNQLPVDEDHVQQSDDNKKTDKPIKCELDVWKAPDGGWGWFIVLGSFLVHVISGGFERANGVIYVQLLSYYKGSATATSWVFSIFSTLRLTMGPLASALCNKYSCRFVVMLGALISSLGVLLSAFVPSMPYLYFTYGVMGGVGRAFAYTPSLIIVGYYFNKKRGIAVGLSTSGVGLGCFVLSPVIKVLFDHYGFQGTFLVLSALVGHFFISGALFRPVKLQKQLMKYERKKMERRQDATLSEPVEKLLPPVTSETRTSNLLSSQSGNGMSSSMELTADMKIESRNKSLIRRKWSQAKSIFIGPKSLKEKSKPLLELSLFKNFAFCALCIQLFMFTLSYNSTFVFLPALVNDRNVSQLEGAYLVAILGSCDGLARIIMSTLLDLKRVKPYRLIIYNIVMFLVALVSLIMPSMETFWQFAIVSAFYGLLSGTYISQKSVVVVDVLGVEKLASSFGLLLLCQGFSAFIGPTVGGLFKDFLGSFDMTFYFGSIGIVAGGFIMAMGNIWLHKQRKNKADLTLKC